MYGVQAQTSCWDEWIATTFFTESSQPIILARITDENFGHAVGDVSADDPSVALVYQSALASLPLEVADCAPMGVVDCLHLPNFADELCEAYASAGIGTRCSATYSVAADQLYRSALPLLRTWLTP